MNKNIIRTLCILLLATLLVACERRPLVDISGKARVRVMLRIRDIPNVTTGIYNSNIKAPEASPGVIRVIFYNADTKDVASQAFISKKGIDENGNEYIEGDVIVYPGRYDIVCYNFDTPTTLIGHTLLIAVNFSGKDASMKISIPEHAFEWMGIPVTEDLHPGTEIEMTVPAYDGFILELV